ncbi:MAG: chalcone isomerase family protein [Paucibacter sp.]|nr:chalcone isomerase family protein [Roseateles sp.]
MRAFLLALFSAALLCTAAHADTVEVAGVKYDTTADVGGQRLVLNGAGIRYKAFFKIYTAGLYLPMKADLTEAALAEPGAKRLHIVALRDIPGDLLGKLFSEGIEANSTHDEFVRSIDGVLKVAKLFATKQELAKGEEFSVDYIPGTGSVISINGKRTGDVIKEPEFYNALLRIWLGKQPADNGLKKALLGQTKPHQRTDADQ